MFEDINGKVLRVGDDVIIGIGTRTPKLSKGVITNIDDGYIQVRTSSNKVVTRHGHRSESQFMKL